MDEIKMSNSVDIVISRFNEDLKWTLEYPFNRFNYIVYNKGPNEEFVKDRVKEIINIDNVGNECHTYLYHCYLKYNELSDITVFLPGSIEQPFKKYKAVFTLEYILTNNCAVFWGWKVNNIKDHLYNFQIDSYRGLSKQNQILHKGSELIPCKSRPFGKWFENVFGNIKVEYWSYNSIFSIDKRDILSKSTEYYKEFYMLFTNTNMELVHYVERCWNGVFYPLNYTVCVEQKINIPEIL